EGEEVRVEQRQLVRSEELLLCGGETPRAEQPPAGVNGAPQAELERALHEVDGRNAGRRIVHIITGLSRGGAEAILYRLASVTRERWDVAVISLTDEGYFGERLRALGIEGLCCHMKPSIHTLPRFLRLVRLLRPPRPPARPT